METSISPLHLLKLNFAMYLRLFFCKSVSVAEQILQNTKTFKRRQFQNTRCCVLFIFSIYNFAKRELINAIATIGTNAYSNKSSTKLQTTHKFLFWVKIKMECREPCKQQSYTIELSYRNFNQFVWLCSRAVFS